MVAQDEWDPFADPAVVAATEASARPQHSKSKVDGGLRQYVQNFSRQTSPGETSDFSRQNSTATFSSGDSLPELTLERAIAMQDELIAAYMDISFQEELWTSSSRAFGNRVEEVRAQTDACLPVQRPVLERFGFEPSRKGVADSNKAFRLFMHIREVTARANHLSFLTSPRLQDPVWKGQVRRKLDVDTGQINNTTLPPLLSLERGLEMEDMLIAEYRKEEFQAQLKAAFAQAADSIAIAKARQKLCFPIQCRIVPLFGFEPSRKGIYQSQLSFKPLLAYPENDARSAAWVELGLASATGNPNDVGKTLQVAKSTFVPGVGLSMCEGEQMQQLRFEMQEVTTLNQWPPMKLPEDAVFGAQFVLDAPYPKVLQKLASRAVPDTADRLSIHDQSAWTYMVELLSFSTAADWGMTHRINLVHTVAPSLTKQHVNRESQAEDIRQRRAYSYKESAEFFRFALPAATLDEKTFVCRSIRNFERNSHLISDRELHDLQLRIVDELENENQTWISIWAPESSEPPASKDISEEHLKTLDTDNPPELTESQAWEFQDMLINGYRSREFQEQLHVAAAKSAGDGLQLARISHKIRMAVQAPVLERFGFPPTRQGVAQSLRVFRSPHLLTDRIQRQGELFTPLIDPRLQSVEFVEDKLSSFANSPAPIYASLRLPELYKADRELVSLAGSGHAAQLRLRLQFQKVDPNIVDCSLCLGGIGMSSFNYVEEKTPLMAAVASGQRGTFDMLLKFQPMVDINFICYDWKIEGPFKRYTALDKAMLSKHTCAPHMLEQLMSLGAKSGYEFQQKITRANPFWNWQDHFPNADFSHLELEDIAHYKSIAEDLGFAEACAFAEEDQAQDKMPASADLSSTNSGKAASRARPWRFPDISDNEDTAVQSAISSIKEHLGRSRMITSVDQHVLLRQLFLEWHPDKRIDSQQLATKVFQWLQDMREKTL